MQIAEDAPTTFCVSEEFVRETSSHTDRYPGFLRRLAAVTTGVVAGVLLLSSIQVGVTWGLGAQLDDDWTQLTWGDHWAWRAVASLAATGAAGFLAGMVSRNHGRLVGVLSAVPTVLYWAFVASTGWLGRILGTSTEVDVSLGYRIVAVLLAGLSIPAATACATEGVAYGHANAEHFDSRRAALLGVRWYHFVWIPFLIHFMLLAAACGAVYGFGWVSTTWQNGMSPLVLVPMMFGLGILWTLRLLGTGAMATYAALAGFDEAAGSVTRRVLKFGIGYTLAAIAAQGAIAVVHSLLAGLIHKISG